MAATARKAAKERMRTSANDDLRARLKGATCRIRTNSCAAERRFAKARLNGALRA